MLPAGVNPPEPGTGAGSIAQAQASDGGGGAGAISAAAAGAGAAPVGAAAGAKPVWRSLPTMTPGAMAAAAYGSAVAPPVYRSLRVVRPAQAAPYGTFRSAPAQATLRGASAASMAQMPGGVKYAGQQPVSVKGNPNFSTRADGSLVYVGPKAAAGKLAVQKSAAQGQQAQQAQPKQAAQAQHQHQPGRQVLTQAPVLPLVFQRSEKHFVVTDVTLARLSELVANVAREQEAELVIKPHKATMKLSKLAPPTAPDGGCSVVMFKVRVFKVGKPDAGQFLLDFTHRKGSRVVACELYREVVAHLRAANAIQTPEHDHLLVAGGGARPCTVYTVPTFRRPTGGGAPAAAEPAVAAATAAPLLAAAASPCFDQQRSSCQLLAKLTASKRAAAAAAAAAGAGAGAGGPNAMDVDAEEEDSSDYMAGAIVGAMYDAGARGAVVNLLQCLCDDQPPAPMHAGMAGAGGIGIGAGAPAVPRPRVHEDVRRCIISTLGNMALMEQQGMAPGVARPAPGAPTALRGLLEQAGALGKVREALPAGANPVHRGTYASVYARDALAAATK